MATQTRTGTESNDARSGLFEIADAAAISDLDTRLSGTELRGEVRTIAQGLLAQGLRPGHRVLVLGRKSVELAAAILAVPAAGGVVVAPYLGMSMAQMRHIVRDLDPLMALALDSAPTALVDLVQGMAETSTVAKVRSAGGAATRTLPVIGPDDPALIVYTSGSTGPPKGVVFSHENLRLGAEAVVRFYPFSPSDRVLCLLPFCFDAGLNQLLSALRAGSDAYLMDFLLPQQTARACEQHEITTLTGVPALWRQLTGISWPPGARASMRRWASTGGHVPVELSRNVCKLFPNADPLLMYGFTEAFRATSLPPRDYADRPTSIGVPIPHAAVAVVDADGALCRPGSTGELVQFGPLVTRGYWNRPEDTRSKYTQLRRRTRRELLEPAQDQYKVPAAWLDRPVWSGDNVFVDEDGSLYFHSRRSMVLKSQGFRVSPTEVEDASRATGLVRDAVAVGIDVAGEESIALMATPASSGSQWSDLHKALMKVLPGHQVPRVIGFRDSIPLTASGKYDLQLVRAELEKEAAHANE